MNYRAHGLYLNKAVTKKQHKIKPANFILEFRGNQHSQACASSGNATCLSLSRGKKQRKYHYLKMQFIQEEKEKNSFMNRGPLMTGPVVSIQK